MSSGEYETLWEPQPGPQTALLQCPYDDVLFGGARGGGKTDAMLGDWIMHQYEYGRYASGIMIRRSIVELEDTIRRAHELFPQVGASWKEQAKTYVFPEGQTLKFRYLEREADAMSYQGHAYTKVYFEELGNWPNSRPIDLMYGTLRSAYGIPCSLRATANPGGPGHAWVKERYITPAPLGYSPIKIDLPSGRSFTRCYIPSRLQDNKILMESDPTYIDRLYLVGSAALVKAWLEGDWDAVEGAYFDSWSSRMIVPPFQIPRDWIKFRSFDWGYAKPFSVGWWAVADGSTPVSMPDGSERIFPRGAMIRYREWYGCTPGRPNEGLRLEVEEIADGILKREAEEIAYGVADPAIFDTSRGPSIAERFAKFRPSWDKTRSPVQWRRGENKRIPGWSQLRARMSGDGDEPMIYVFSTCVDSIRLIPVMQHDKVRAEDLDTDAEDHIADEWRYAAMSRPMPNVKKEKKVWKNPLTMDNLAPVAVPKHERLTIL